MRTEIGGIVRFEAVVVAVMGLLRPLGERLQLVIVEGWISYPT